MFTVMMALFFISFIVMGALMFGFTGKYLTSRREKELNHIAQEIIDITVYAGTNREISPGNYALNINTIAASTGTEVFVLDANGEIIITSVKEFDGKIRKIFTKGILSGRDLVFHGNLGGVFGIDMLTVARPIRYHNQIVGGVLVSVPTPEITGIRTEIVRILVFNMLLVMVVAAIMMYVLSKRTTKSLRELNEAAKSIANGDLKKRVSVDAGMEVTELCETFNQMAESIEQLEKMRSSFIANVSHDLRTPMTTIIGFVEGILDGTIPEDKKSWYLSIVLDESKRLSRIVTDLLDLSKMEQGSFNIEKRNFDVSELIRLTVIKFEKRITEKNISLTVGFDAERLLVLADRDAISRVLTNVIDNALKFTPEGGFIDVQAGTKDGRVYVSVQNSGTGIEEKDLRHIFDRFYKTDKSRSKDKNGAGLGLYIVKSIINAHGETVWAESKPGEFARFSFTLEQAEEKKKQTEDEV